MNVKKKNIKIFLTEYKFVLLGFYFLIKFEKVSFERKKSDIIKIYFIEYEFTLIE